MKENPLVSVVTPSLNQGRFIDETILSVKNQTYRYIEHIVMDGGSTDGTLDILRKYDHSITWVSEPDQGQSDAINKGWRRTKGEILGWLNSDDTYMPWAVETAVKFFAEHPDVSMVYGDARDINERGEVIRQCKAGEFDLTRALCFSNNVPQPTVFLLREALDKVGYLDPELHFAMDLDLWIRIGLKFKIGYIDKPIANFRVCPGTKTMSQAYWVSDDCLRILDKTFSNPDLPREVRALKRQAYGCAHWRIFSAYYSQRQAKHARRHLIRSVLWYPQRLWQRQVVIYFLLTFLGWRAGGMASGLRRRLGGG